MVRFYKSYLGRLLLGMLILIELEKQGGKTAVIEAVQKWTGTEAEGYLIENAIETYVHGYTNESPDNIDVLQGVFGQLNKGKNHETDLLDTIVQVLRLPFVNYISTGSIKMLREALLTPTELVDLKTSFKSSSKCGCGHVFSNSEAVSIVTLDGCIILQCTKCARPTYVRCDSCDGIVALRGKVAGSWINNPIDCGCGKKDIPVATPQVTDAARRLREQAANLRVQNRMLRERPGLRENAVMPAVALPADDTGVYNPFGDI